MGKSLKEEGIVFRGSNFAMEVQRAQRDLKGNRRPPSCGDYLHLQSSCDAFTVDLVFDVWPSTFSPGDHDAGLRVVFHVLLQGVVFPGHGGNPGRLFSG